jgi:thiamine biosynthesis lipoprotein
MGSVLSLWHEARNEGINDPERAKLPDTEALKEAAKHCSFDTVIIDEEYSTVYLEDPQQRLDVGAIAKGWSTQKVCENLPDGFLVSVGGNVCASGPKPENNGSWVVGIQDPEGGADDYLHTIYVNQESVVTSGDYQRYYTVEGKEYHHIIDPETLYPALNWKAVSIICTDSGLGDALSTALFLLDREEGQKLLDKYDAQAMWVDQNGETYYSPGFKELIRT